MTDINSKTVIQKQYGSDSNLASRIRVKQAFSTGKTGWADFLLQNFCLKSKQRVLELGCGNAVFWKAVSNRIPTDIRLVLSDVSQGMLDAAKKNTSELKFIEEYAVIDVQDIPYDNNSFDIIVANYMLGFVPNIDKALNEISRVLKPNGVLFSANYGKYNLKEVDDIFAGFDSRTDAVVKAVCKAFGLENGAACLEKHFDSIQLQRYENNLHITELDSLIEYLLSYRGMGNVSEIISEDRIPLFVDYVTDIFSKNGFVDITQDEGLFIAKHPIK